ncbi:hypothetical protein [Bordetella hinzii]|uniref:hypothetical protein n=1 Tax=Bordetella hinzii TaxID=103855 RepID=UPI00114EAA99|nr:hypothetical protein [Bordetella hinzii]
MNDITLVTAHGRQNIPCREDQRIIDALIENQIPWSAISLYQMPRLGGPYVATTGLDKKYPSSHPTSTYTPFIKGTLTPSYFVSQI